ncbi:protein BatD [Ornithobacterium rhinotracheale]|uniref:BatD family protein n=1 Tax=Ornithobacterium rhinotracheale TaxID=28251 RepID=UPI00129CDD92|nr:BatD family protein [Ornithobacterium rhinotracheale]MRJ07476.1 protein BatD [Ornithobacterium rhinotracheale]UOH78070.1 BatD family protein [Ornithobacterium rhinotracheale]
MKIEKYLFALFSLLSCFGYGQYSFTAVPNKDRVQVGEDFELNFVITLSDNADIGNIKYPSFNGLKMIGRRQGQQINIINGEKTIQNIETIILRAEKKGKIKISSASVKINHRHFETSPVYITVVDAPRVVQRSNYSNQLVFLDLDLSQNSAFPNEPIYATLKLYAKSFEALRRRSDVGAPILDNFEVKQINLPNNDYRDIKQEVYNNQTYVSEVVGKYILLPQKTGNLDIRPFLIHVAIPIDFFDEKIVELYSPVKSVDVKNFPAHAPKTFNGAVGSFALKTYVQKKNLRQNKAFEIEVELEGEGSFSTISLPKLKLNKELEVYPPRRREAFKPLNGTEKGKIVDSYVVVPQYGGTYDIPSVEFTYFDLDKKKYVTLHSNAEQVQVEGEPNENPIIDDSLSMTIPMDSTATIDTPREEARSNTPKLNKSTKVIPAVATNDAESEDTANWWPWVLGLGSIILIIPLFFLFLRKKKTKEEVATPIITLKDIKNDWNNATANQSGADFYRETERILQEIVQLYTQEPSTKSEEEAVAILKTHKNDNFAAAWQALYQKVQMAQYAGINEEHQREIAVACSDLIKNI